MIIDGQARILTAYVVLKLIEYESDEEDGCLPVYWDLDSAEADNPDCIIERIQVVVTDIH